MAVLVDQMLSGGVVKEFESLGQPSSACEKECGGLRFCVDYRRLEVAGK